MTKLTVRQPGTTHPGPSAAVRAAAWAGAAWCLAFAAVSVVQLVSGGPASEEYPRYATGFAVMGVLVLVLKLLGAAVALASVSPRPGRLVRWPLGASLWGAASLLALYSVGNIVIAVGTLTGLLEPSAAWEASGGVTGRSVSYLFFFLVAAPLFGALAVSYQRRVRPGRAAVMAGVAGAPLLLGSVLVAVPALLAAMDRMP